MTVVAVTLALVVRNQVKVYRGREARTTQERQSLFDQAQRRMLFDMLRPVAMANCRLKRFGEANDGGYLMCGNLLTGIESGYSYGISGYDKWGCDVSSTLRVPVHQYDCFNLTEPACPGGKTMFHAECVGDTAATIDGRPFDTIENQFSKNGDSMKRVVLKIDVEGAEWDSLLAAPDDVLQRIDQLVIEFHWELDKSQWVRHERYTRLVSRLKQFFEIAHIHFNNASCVAELQPFPSWAYEVLFVSKRLAVINPSGRAGGREPAGCSEQSLVRGLPAAVSGTMRTGRRRASILDYRSLDYYAEGTEEQRLTATLIAVEGPGWMNRDLDSWLADGAARERLLQLLRRVETEPALMGASAHLLAAVARHRSPFLPHAADLDDQLDRLVHVLRRHPFEPGVEVVLTGEQVRRRQPHERKPRAVGAAADRPFERLDPIRRSPRARGRPPRMVVQHLAHVAVTAR